MTQATKRRTGIFPIFQSNPVVLRSKSSAELGRLAPRDLSALPARPAAAVITARGQRFAIHEIGSMFGSE